MATFVPKKKKVNEASIAAQDQTGSSELSRDLIVVGRIGTAYGVKGWAKIHPFSHYPDAMLHAQTWWIAPYIPNQDTFNATWQKVTPLELKPHGDAWVALCREWTDRTHVEQLKGWQIAVSRTDFPETDEDEFYWADLIGAQVINQQGIALGEVYALLESAAHTVLQIRSKVLSDNALGEDREYLIPFVSAFVGEVDVHSNPKTIVVDWDVDSVA